MWKKIDNSDENFIKNSLYFPEENVVFELKNNNNISYLIFSNITPYFMTEALTDVKNIVIWKNI